MISPNDATNAASDPGAEALQPALEALAGAAGDGGDAAALLDAFAHLLAGAGTVRLSAEGDELRVNDRPAPVEIDANISARAAQALRARSIGRLTVSSGAGVGDYARLAEVMAGRRSPQDFVSDRIAVELAPSATRSRRDTVRRVRFEMPEAPEAKPAERYAPDSLGPEPLKSVDGVPPGADPIRIESDDLGRRLLASLDRLLDDNERATAAAVVWRVLAAFEVAHGDDRLALAEFLEELEPRIWRTRLTEGFKALEDALARELRREVQLRRDGQGDDLALDLITRSAARAMHEFLRAGQYSRLERLGRIMTTMGPEDGGDERCEAAAQRSLERLGRTDFFDLLLSDLSSESTERSSEARDALRPVARAVRGRLIDIVRSTKDYRLRLFAAEALASSGPEGGVEAIAQLGPTMPEDEYERIISVLDALGLDPEVAEGEVVQAINHPADSVRRQAVSVLYRLPLGSTLGVLQRAIDSGGALGALRTVQAIGELRLIGAFPIVQKQINDSTDPGVLDAACRTIGRMASEPDVARLRAVKLLANCLRRLPELPDRAGAEQAALTAIWAASQYHVPEAREAVDVAMAYPSPKVAAFARRVQAQEAEVQ